MEVNAFVEYSHMFCGCDVGGMIMELKFFFL